MIWFSVIGVLLGFFYLLLSMHAFSKKKIYQGIALCLTGVVLISLSLIGLPDKPKMENDNVHCISIA